MDNLELWEKVANVPDNAQKKIQAGRLKGMTDINPLWRIKVLTEQFGICGIGWVAPIKEKWIEPGDNGTMVANVMCTLKIKVNGEWSEGIDGIGGSMFIAKESKGLYTSDEAYKMAYTDAISVACKMIGIGADIYWQGGASKYNVPPGQRPTAGAQASARLQRPPKMQELIQLMNKIISSKSMTADELAGKMSILSSEKKYTDYTECECETAIAFLTPFLKEAEANA